MSFYSDSKPQLIATKIIDKMNDTIKKGVDDVGVKDNVTQYSLDIINAVILPNKYFFGALIIIIIVLFILYCRKQDKEEQDEDKIIETFSDDLNDNMNYNQNQNIKKKKDRTINNVNNIYDIDAGNVRYPDNLSENLGRNISGMIENQTCHLRQNIQPTFNPLYSVRSQQVGVDYPPGPIPMNIDGNIVPTQNMYPPSTTFGNLIDPEANYENQNYMEDLLYYTGTNNTYKNAIDTTILNPLGYPNNFNTTTGDFVTQMTDLNKETVADYNDHLKRKINNTIINAEYGPKYTDCTINANVLPPYAPDVIVDRRYNY